jgi:hypothetical protein
MQFNKLRLLRLRWAYEAMIGRKMSVRVKHTNIGERLSAELVKMMDEGVITRKDKRELIRKIEILLQLDTGTLGTKPGQKEVKRRVRGRLSAKSAAIAEANAAVGNKVVSLAATRGKLNLANIMEKR